VGDGLRHSRFWESSAISAGTTNDPEGPCHLPLMQSQTCRPLMRSLDAPPVDAISGWFGADLSGSTLMMQPRYATGRAEWPE
jgi:hypothetical protein